MECILYSVYTFRSKLPLAGMYVHLTDDTLNVTFELYGNTMKRIKSTSTRNQAAASFQKCTGEREKKSPNRRRRWTTKKIKRKHPQNSSAANFLQQSPIYHLHQIPTESPNYDGSGRKKVGLIVSCA